MERPLRDGDGPVSVRARRQVADEERLVPEPRMKGIPRDERRGRRRFVPQRALHEGRDVLRSAVIGVARGELAGGAADVVEAAARAYLRALTTLGRGEETAVAAAADLASAP